MTIVQEQFVDTKTAVSADERGRIALGSGTKDTIYKVSKNDIGQILLTPVVMVPAHELWLLNNPEAMASIQRGLAELAAGLGVPMNFAQYADIETGE